MINARRAFYSSGHIKATKLTALWSSDTPKKQRRILSQSKLPKISSVLLGHSMSKQQTQRLQNRPQTTSPWHLPACINLLFDWEPQVERFGKQHGLLFKRLSYDCVQFKPSSSFEGCPPRFWQSQHISLVSRGPSAITCSSSPLTSI